MNWHNRVTRWSKTVLAGVLSAGVAACSTSGTPFEGMFGDVLPPSCPDVRILAQAVSNTQFVEGAGRDLTDINAEARLADFQALCQEETDDETGIGTVTVELTTAFVAVRGPANQTRDASFPYFVSLIDEEQNVISKNVFDVVIDFQGNAFRTTVFDEPVVLRIPIRPPLRGSMFSIYLGMQLTEEDLRYNDRIGPTLLDG